MLLGEYDCSLRNIVAIIDPQSAAAVPQLLLKPQVSEQIRLQHLLVCFKRCFATVTVVLLGVLVAWTATLDTRYAQRLSNPLVWMPAMTLLVALLIELIVTDIRQNFDLHPSVQTLTRSDGMFCRRCSMHGMKARTT
ncbi:hypothetical protein PS914_04526 [Pseudomonas fluorescens]|uniref:Uncharacterized protein n=2 Tax=Pseudomonas fluorescens TaxID=294 RepID=A0A5E7CR55_PSEFL|nr:hypothetical protein PS833_02930 [Pseudomonas fluorescens]VVQ05597.1 hypothetical protein PS914_04526 [Pseudomonas fluorescens]